MATDDVAMDCFLNMHRALPSTVRSRDAAPAEHAGHAGHAGHAAHALSMTRVSNFPLIIISVLAQNLYPDLGWLHVQALHKISPGVGGWAISWSCNWLWTKTTQLHQTTVRVRFPPWHCASRSQEAELHQQTLRLLSRLCWSCLLLWTT